MTALLLQAVVSLVGFAMALAIVWALRFLAGLLVPGLGEEPLLCARCGADMNAARIVHTSRGHLVHCPRCGAAHDLGEEG